MHEWVLSQWVMCHVTLINESESQIQKSTSMDESRRTYENFTGCTHTHTRTHTHLLNSPNPAKFSHEWVMSQTWHICKWVMVHIYISHGAHMNALWCTYEWVTSHIWWSHVTFPWVTSHTCRCHITHTHTNTHTHTHTHTHTFSTPSTIHTHTHTHLLNPLNPRQILTWMRHVTHMNESRHIQTCRLPQPPT